MNDTLLERLPYDPHAEAIGLELRGVARGDWARATRFWWGLPATMLACTGSRPEDLWFGTARTNDSYGYFVLAFEVEGLTGEELLEIWRDDVLQVDEGLFLSEVHKNRRYLISKPSEDHLRFALYAAGPTFYIFQWFCCVDPSPDSPPLPSAQELIEGLLEQLPLE